MSIPIIATGIYLFLILFYENEMYMFRISFLWEYSRVFTIIENMGKNDGGWKKRIGFEILRVYVSNLVRMGCFLKSEWDRILGTFPFAILAIIIVYSLGIKFWNKVYLKNVLLRSVGNIEYQYGKSINYIRLIVKLQKSYPDNPIFWGLTVYLVEAYATNSAVFAEEYVLKGKLNFSSLIRNTKIYGAVNMTTILYYIFDPKPQDYIHSFEIIYRLARFVIFVILLIAVGDKMQKAFYKETVVDQLSKLYRIMASIISRKNSFMEISGNGLRDLALFEIQGTSRIYSFMTKYVLCFRLFDYGSCF